MIGAAAVEMDVSHLDLLRRATALELAATRGDVDAVHTELCALRNALVEHVLQEESVTEQLSPVLKDMVHRGQRRLLRSIDELLGHAHAHGDECRCVARAIRIRETIFRQATLENRISRPPT